MCEPKHFICFNEQRAQPLFHNTVHLVVIFIKPKVAFHLRSYYLHPLLLGPQEPNVGSLVHQMSLAICFMYITLGLCQYPQTQHDEVFLLQQAKVKK
jgi:hypothetical protein